MEFAIIRCGFGMNQTKQDDAQWFNNVKGCEENNIPYGVYLIFLCRYSNKRRKVRRSMYLRLIKGHTLAYPVYYDIEEKAVLNQIDSRTVRER